MLMEQAACTTSSLNGHDSQSWQHAALVGGALCACPQAMPRRCCCPSRGDISSCAAVPGWGWASGHCEASVQLLAARGRAHTAPLYARASPRLGLSYACACDPSLCCLMHAHAAVGEGAATGATWHGGLVLFLVLAAAAPAPGRLLTRGQWCGLRSVEGLPAGSLCSVWVLPGSRRPGSVPPLGR
jgi:hypothetical protein